MRKAVIKEPKPRCPECKSRKTQKHGTMRTKAGLWQRYRCTNCGQTFTRWGTKND